MPFVLDCSVALAWVFPDESSPELDRLQDSLESDFAIVPAHWSLEFANALLMARRRGRISVAQMKTTLAWIGELSVEVDDRTFAQGLNSTLTLADKYGLTSYDAAYLELAIRSGFPLATLDKALKAAAVRSGIRTL